ncbi:MAG: hypothetical protein ACI9T8_000056 [Candidatus Saccharimonadales bacterium]|jgi:hypothetical protein
MIEQLFGSKTRVKLLKLFFSNPNRPFYVREITRKIEEQINSVRRELANMLSLGLITSEESNNKLYYEVNQKYEHYDALQSMFADIKTSKPKTAKPKADAVLTGTKKEPTTATAETEPTTVELPEAQQWAKVGNVTGIAYSGVFTRDETAGVDILIVGDVVLSKVESVVSSLEKDHKNPLRFAVIENDEWKYRGQVRDKFWVKLMSAKKQIVLDKDSVFSNK